ncbi:MAG: hypothetical protein IPK23_14860 [Rhizobiales bacterium]|nr:hypothetical protein [Hyphomicrobiales bacterium]
MKHANNLSAAIEQSRQPAKEPIDDAVFWHGIRELANKISQCVHEANAYNNVMLPDEDGEEVFYLSPKAEG